MSAKLPKYALIVALAIFMFLGAFGGLVAQELFGPKEPKPDERVNTKTT